MDLYAIRNMLSGGKSIYDLPLRVTFYARVSTDRYEQLNSLENQVMYFENFIKKQENWTFVEGYVDEGISGTSVKKREDFLRMVDDAKKRKFNLILTKEISRFSRNTLDSIKYTQELLISGVGVHFLSDNINTFQPDSELRLTIMSSIAQEEIRKLSERVRFGYKRSVEKGRVPGSNNIYGYTKNKGKLEIDEEQAKFIRLIFETYVSENIGVHRLGFKLFEEYGVTNYSGKPIAGTVIKNIIRNPKYKGYFCAHKETTVDYHDRKRKKFSRDEWIVYKDNETCPPIVSEELWDKANEILDARSKKHDQINKNNKYNKFPFSGLMHCYYDGATFVRGTYQVGKGDRSRRRRFWACNNYRIHGKKKTEGCNSPVIYYEELVEVCKKILNMILVSQDDLISEINDMISDIRTKKDYKKEIKIIDEKLFKKNNEKKELIMMRLRKEINLNEYNTLKDDLDSQINLLEENKRKLLEEEQNKESSEKNFESFKKRVNDIVFSDDDKVLELAEVIFEDIRVESIKDDEMDQKVILHAKLNVFDGKEETFDFEKFYCFSVHARDAAAAIASYVAGSEEKFVKLMNDKALELGMKNTIFYNASGLPTPHGNYSSVYDMALLTSYAMKNELYREIVSTKKHKVTTNYKTYIWENKNKLLRYDYITGGKTGYTEESGRTLVSTATIDDMKLVVVTIRDSDDWNTHIELYNYAKDNYNSYKVLNKEKFKVFGDTYYKDSNLYIKNDVYIPLKKTEKRSLINHIVLEKRRSYNNGDKIGTNQIYLDKELLYEENIYIAKDNATKDSKKKSIFTKIKEWFND